MIGMIRLMSSFPLATEAATIRLANGLASVLETPLSIYFSGDIGVGKTFFIRALLKALGVSSPIKSPTFSLVETYEQNGIEICHFDLYRVNHEEELTYMGFSELFETSQLRLLEWPEKAPNLPCPDVLVHLTIFDQGHHADIQSKTKRGEVVLSKLVKQIV